MNARSAGVQYKNMTKSDAAFTAIRAGIDSTKARYRMTEPLILSASSISSWLRCRRQYLYMAVYRVTGQQNVAAALGSAVHKGVETFWHGPLRPAGALRSAFIKETASIPAEEMNADPGALQDGTRMLGAYIGKVAPTFTPTMVEQEFLISVAEVPGILVAGTIDAADESDIHDLKTVSMISKFQSHYHAMQMNLYGLGYKALTGRPAKRLLLDVLTRKGNVPYRQVEVEIDVAGTIDVLGVARDAILAGDYAPTGAENGACNWCAYKEICPSVNLT